MATNPVASLTASALKDIISEHYPHNIVLGIHQLIIDYVGNIWTVIMIRTNVGVSDGAAYLYLDTCVYWMGMLPVEDVEFLQELYKGSFDQWIVGIHRRAALTIDKREGYTDTYANSTKSMYDVMVNGWYHLFDQPVLSHLRSGLNTLYAVPIIKAVVNICREWFDERKTAITVHDFTSLLLYYTDSKRLLDAIISLVANIPQLTDDITLATMRKAYDQTYKTCTWVFMRGANKGKTCGGKAVTFNPVRCNKCKNRKLQRPTEHQLPQPQIGFGLLPMAAT